MKMWTRVILVLMCMALVVHAQNEDLINKKVAQITDAVDLSETQVKQLTEILKKERESMREMREKGREQGRRGGRGAMREAMTARKEVTDAQIMNILTDEQVPFYEEYKEKGITDERTLMLMERLKLSDAQAHKIQKIYRANREEAEKMRAESDGDFGSMREKMRAMRGETDKKVSGVLNEEQQKEYKKYQEEMRQQFKNRGRGMRRD